MTATTPIGNRDFAATEKPAVADQELTLLLDGPAGALAVHSHSGIVIGDLIALKDDGRTPLVVFQGQPGSAAVRARSVVDLNARHIGRQVVLMFESADAGKPIVMGVLRDGNSSPLYHDPGHIDIDADNERLIVSAGWQLVLRCGSASITLTKDGKVLIQGTFVSTRSSGVNRIIGGSVQIN